MAKKYSDLSAQKPQVIRIPVREVPALQSPRALSSLQEKVLLKELEQGAGLPVRINLIGGPETQSMGNDLKAVFKGWSVSGAILGSTSIMTVGCDPGEPSELEFAIPNSQDRSVQIAIHAFDRAKVFYTKNVSMCAYTGPASMGVPPALTINVRDKKRIN